MWSVGTVLLFENWYFAVIPPQPGHCLFSHFLCPHYLFSVDQTVPGGGQPDADDLGRCPGSHLGQRLW
jgi:hypothetical protein